MLRSMYGVKKGLKPPYSFQIVSQLLSEDEVNVNDEANELVEINEIVKVNEERASETFAGINQSHKFKAIEYRCRSFCSHEVYITILTTSSEFVSQSTNTKACFIENLLYSMTSHDFV